MTEMKSVYCAVGTGSLNKAVCASSLKGQFLPLTRGCCPQHAVSNRPNSVSCFHIGVTHSRQRVLTILTLTQPYQTLKHLAVALGQNVIYYSLLVKVDFQYRYSKFSCLVCKYLYQWLSIILGSLVQCQDIGIVKYQEQSHCGDDFFGYR